MKLYVCFILVVVSEVFVLNVIVGVCNVCDWLFVVYLDIVILLMLFNYDVEWINFWDIRFSVYLVCIFLFIISDVVI